MTEDPVGLMHVPYKLRVGQSGGQSGVESQVLAHFHARTDGVSVYRTRREGLTDSHFRVRTTPDGLRRSVLFHAKSYFCECMGGMTHSAPTVNSFARAII